MTIHVKAGGIFREVDDPQVKVGGVFREVEEAYVKVGGVWQLVYERALNFFPDGDVDVTRATGGRCGIQFRTDGSIWTQNTSGTSENYSDSGLRWVEQDVSSGYDIYVRATRTAGTDPAGDALTPTWLKIAGASSANRDWYKVETGGSVNSCVLTFDLSFDAGTVEATQAGNTIQVSDTP